MANGITAKTNERVVVSKDFSIVVPEGFEYSTDTELINDNRALVFIKKERNDYYNNIMGDDEPCSLSSPFAAPQCCTVVPTKDFGGELDLSTPEVKTSIKQLSSQMLSMLSANATPVKETSDVFVSYSKFSDDMPQTFFLIFTSSKIYTGQIWINDIETAEERNEIALKWLNSIEKYILTDEDKNPSKPFVVPTYNENKREQVGPITVAVPDQMMTLNTIDSLNDPITLSGLKKDMVFMAINKDFNSNLTFYKDAEYLITVTSGGIAESNILDNLWGNEKLEQRKETLTSMLRRNSLSQSSYEIHYMDLGDNLAALYTQLDEKTDDIEQFASFAVLLFYNNCIIQMNIRYKAIVDIPAMTAAIENWIAKIRPASEEEQQAYKDRAVTAALDSFAGKNGKIDGVKASQLFFEDVFFFVKGQMVQNGNHHKVKGVQLNASVIDNYPQIKQNLPVFGKAITDMLKFVEEDEFLVLDKKCVHFEFDKLNDVDLPIINGFPVNVENSEIGKQLTGARIFLFIAYHMIKIAEVSTNNYAVLIDRFLFDGIPDARAYICQLIKTLRAYNNITEGFSVTAASFVNCDSPIEYIPNNCNPMSNTTDIMEPVSVSENENPYEPILKKIAEADKNGVWEEWERGKKFSGDGFFDEDFIDESPSVDSQGRLSPSDIKTSKSVEIVLNKIGRCKDKPSIKGKIFVLTEVNYPEILEEYIVRNGGEVKSSTVLKTDYLIIGDGGSGGTVKAKRAIELNTTKGKSIKAMSENDFWFMMSDEFKKTLPKTASSEAKASKPKKVSNDNTSATVNTCDTEIIKKQDSEKNEEEKRLAEEKAAKEAEKKRIAKEKAAKEADKKRLAKEKVAKEAEEKRLAEEKAAKEAEKKRLAEEKAAKEAEEKRIAQEKEAKNSKKKLFKFLTVLVCIPLVISILFWTTYSVSAKLIKDSFADNLEPVVDELYDIPGVKNVDVKIYAEPEFIQSFWYLEYHGFMTVEFSDLSHLSDEKMLEILNAGEESGKREYSYDGSKTDSAIYTRSITDQIFGSVHPVFVTLSDGNKSYTLKEGFVRSSTELYLGDAHELLRPTLSDFSIISFFAVMAIFFLALLFFVIYKRIDLNYQDGTNGRKQKVQKIILIVTAAVVVVAAIGLSIVGSVIERTNLYNEAVALKNAGNDDKAYHAFKSLGEFKDAEEICQEYDYEKALTHLDNGNDKFAFYILKNLKKYKDAESKVAKLLEEHSHFNILNAKPGDEIVLGRYEQDNNLSNGPEEIKWTVLKNENGVLYAVSKYILDSKSYNTNNSYASTLKPWLKNDFSSSAFSGLPEGFINKVGLLSRDDMEIYETFANTMPEWTAYAKAQGPDDHYYDGYSWWLDGEYFKGYGSNHVSMSIVTESGAYSANVCDITDINGVRPAIIIDYVSENIDYYASDNNV